MMCRSCEGSGKQRNNSSSKGKYIFNKVICDECEGRGEVPLHMTHDELTKEANSRVEISCLREDCGYYIASDAAVLNYFRVAMDGGFVMYDGHGGTVTCCPLCSEDKLQIEPIDQRGGVDNRRPACRQKKGGDSKDKLITNCRLFQQVGKQEVP